MQIGTLALFQRHSYDDSVTDSQVYREELALASQIEAQGYDSHWCVEHHLELIVAIIAAIPYLLLSSLTVAI